MEKNSAASLLTSVDSLFTTQEERDIANRPRVQEIPVDKIDDFPNHPFKIRMMYLPIPPGARFRTTISSVPVCTVSAPPVTAGSWFTEALRGKFCPRQRENIVSVMAAITALKKIAMPPLLSGS